MALSQHDLQQLLQSLSVFLGSAWQRCRVHFVRDVLAKVPQGSGEMVAATIRTVFAQADAEAVRTHLGTVASMLGRQFPQVEQMLTGAAVDITAFADLPGGIGRRSGRPTRWSG